MTNLSMVVWCISIERRENDFFLVHIHLFKGTIITTDETNKNLEK